MSEPELPAVDELQAELPQDELRALGLVVLGLAAGLVTYMGLVALFAAGVIPLQTSPAGDQRGPGDQQLVLFSGVNALMFLGAQVAAALVPRLALQREAEALQRGQGRSAQAVTRAWFAAFRSATILRGALAEGPGLFGVVIVFLATLSGRIDELGWVWLNLLPGGVALSLLLSNLPTPERVAESYREHVINRLG